MAGTSQSNIRSARVAETTIGTTPPTPGFITSHDRIDIFAKPEVYEQTSLTTGGTVVGVGNKSIPVTGAMSGALTYGSLDDLFASLMQGTWATNVLKDAKTASGFTVENTFDAGAGGTATMLRGRGVEPVGGKIAMASNAEVQYSFDLRGVGFTAATTTGITGATYTDPTNATPMTSGVDVGALTFGGYTPGGFQSAEIDFAFVGREPQVLMNSFDTGGTTLGAFRPKITAKAFVDTGFMAMYNAAMAVHSTFAATFHLGSVSGSKYTIAFPAVSFADAGIDLSGNELMQDIELIPQDDGSGAVVTITRAVA